MTDIEEGKYNTKTGIRYACRTKLCGRNFYRVVQVNRNGHIGPEKIVSDLDSDTVTVSPWGFHEICRVS